MDENKVLLKRNDIRIEYYFSNLQAYYDKMLSDLENELKGFLTGDYFFMEGKNVYYDKKTVALFPIFKDFLKKDTQKNVISILLKELDYFSEGNGFTWDFLTAEEVKKTFSHNVIHPFKFGDYYLKFAEHNASYLSYKEGNKISFYYTFSNSYDEEYGTLIGIHRLKGENAVKVSIKEMLILWLENGLIPRDITGAGKTSYINLLKEFEKYKIIYNEEGKIGSFDRENVVNSIFEGKFQLSGERVGRTLLNVDARKLGIAPYTIERLYDKNFGHWDIFPNDITAANDYHNVNVDQTMYMRDPSLDIKDGGVIGIDFGSRSCVVAYQEENDLTLPVVFGKNLFSKKNIYENASALYINNLEKFINDYNSSISRPCTSWEDIYIPTLDEMNEKTNDPNLFRNLIEKSTEKIDFVEVYAYYIGSFINNMNNGVYLDYILSFSPLVSKDIRERVLESFKKGIKKSLPLGILARSDISERLNVTYGSSNGTAYAVSAINQFGLSPQDDKTVLFASFEAGAMFTDFSFGFLRASNRKKYDYILEDFEVHGDENLGGEKVLQEMAIEVFKENIDVIAENSINFSISNFYTRNSLSSYKNGEETFFNMNSMINALRNFIERAGEREIFYPEHEVKVDLINEDKLIVKNLRFKLDFTKLDKIAYKMVVNCINGFFLNMNTIFNRVQSYVKCKNVNIFVGGNFGKSYYVNGAFEKIVERENEKNDYNYKLYPVVENMDFSKANSKTGVVFGVLNSKLGGRIKLVHRNSDNTVLVEDQFGYYVGYNNKGSFKCILHPNSSLEKWEELFEADEEIFEIYYTKVNEAATNNLDILKTKRKRIKIENIRPDNFIFIRPKNKNVLEYIVCTREAINEPIFSEDIKSVELDEQ